MKIIKECYCNICRLIRFKLWLKQKQKYFGWRKSKLIIVRDKLSISDFNFEEYIKENLRVD